MNSSNATKTDLAEFIAIANDISSDTDEEIEESLLAAREQRLDPTEMKRLRSRVVSVMTAGAAGEAAATSDSEPTSHIKGGWGPVSSGTEPRTLFASWATRMPHSRLALVALIVIALPCVGYLASSVGTSAGVHEPRHTIVFGSENHSYDNLFAHSFPNHLVYVNGSAEGFSFNVAHSGKSAGNAANSGQMNQSGQKAGTSSGSEDIIQTDDLTIRVKPETAENAAGTAQNIASSEGGRVVSQTRQGTNSVVSMTVSVPSRNFSKTLTKLRNIGIVEYENLSSQDVGLQVVNLGAKIQNYQSQRAILLALFNKAKTVSATIRVQQVLSNVQSQIDQLQSQARYLAGRISQATISMTFVTHKPAAAAPVKKPANPLIHALSNAGTATTNVVTGVIVLIGYALPLAILGLLGFGIFALVQRRRSPRGSVAHP